MKQAIFFLAFITMVQMTLAQDSRYVAAMKQNIKQIDSAKTCEQLDRLSASFERIGDAEKNAWLPYYYAALCKATCGYRDARADKDAIAEKANLLLEKAEAINRNAEIAVVKYMIASLQLQVNPMSRWEQYGPLMQNALTEGKKLDANNPRIFYMEGTNLFYTPVNFGGGKDAARPVLEKSLQLFASDKNGDDLAPRWGQASAEALLAKCQPTNK